MKILLIFFMLSSYFSIGQNMKNHLWKHRVVLIYTDDSSSELFKNQTAILKNHQKELDERKVVVYSFTKDAYTFNLENNWKKSAELFLKYNPKNTPFKVMLIGLDGGIKLAQPTVLSKEKLFAIIDGMPMRKREIRNNNN